MSGSSSMWHDTAQRVVENVRIYGLTPARGLGGSRSDAGGSRPVQEHYMVLFESARAPETFTKDPPARRYGRIERSALRKILHFSEG